MQRYGVVWAGNSDNGAGYYHTPSLCMQVFASYEHWMSTIGECCGNTGLYVLASHPARPLLSVQISHLCE